jgi:hypothetical protein
VSERRTVSASLCGENNNPFVRGEIQIPYVIMEPCPDEKTSFKKR